MVESDYKMKSIEKRFLIYKKELKKKGISSFVKNRAQRIKDEFLYLSVRYLRPEKYFTYNGKKYQYLISRYNYSWKNERTVEVPLIYYHVLKVKKNKNILEIGNVLSHYYKIDHDIVDKYEKAPGVINEDVVKFKSNKKYDLIIAISTLEHVGWDERPQEPKKITPTLRHLRTLLKKDGKILITLPIGYYNPFLNSEIVSEKLKLNKRYYMRRTSILNKWEQVKLDEVKDVKYNSTFPNANAILVGEISLS